MIKIVSFGSLYYLLLYGRLKNMQRELKSKMLIVLKVKKRRLPIFYLKH